MNALTEDEGEPRVIRLSEGGMVIGPAGDGPQVAARAWLDKHAYYANVTLGCVSGRLLSQPVDNGILVRPIARVSGEIIVRTRSFCGSSHKPSLTIRFRVAPPASSLSDLRSKMSAMSYRPLIYIPWPRSRK
jgi:hypothetical protein